MLQFRLKVYRNLSQVETSTNNKKVRTNRSLIQANQKINPFMTQAQSPIRNKPCKQNKENVQNPQPNDLLITHFDESMELDYSPSSCKKRQQPQSFQVKKSRNQIVSKKCQLMMNIYGQKAPVKSKSQLQSVKNTCIRIR